ncbi:MAG: hypothetical protein PVH31_01275 [Ectothiorhodospiraceae bacterium]
MKRRTLILAGLFALLTLPVANAATPGHDGRHHRDGGAHRSQHHRAHDGRGRHGVRRFHRTPRRQVRGHAWHHRYRRPAWRYDWHRPRRFRYHGRYRHGHRAWWRPLHR